MKHSKVIARYLALILGLAVITSFPWNCKPGSQPLKIAVMGDQTGSYDLDLSYVIMARAAERMKKHSPNLLIHVGDMTESRVMDLDEYEQDFNTAAYIMASVGAPWYLAAGDHDVNPPRFEPGSKDRSNEARFQKLCAGIGLPVEEQLYYSVDFQDYHLIFLYSLETLHSDPRWGSIFLNQISEEQLDWLRSDLDENRDARGILVVTHHPHWYSWSNWYRVHKVLRNYPVAAVIAGHYHYDQDDGVIDGINYLVLGATGGAIKDADAESGGCHEYALLTLDGGTVSSYELHEVFSDSILERTSRRSMDRIQALSTSMSNIYGDEKLVLKGNQLISIDKSNRGITRTLLDIESIANPIDLPVELSIHPVGTVLKSPRWVGSKAGLDGGHALILEPGERCSWANYSSSGQWFAPAAIWEADLADEIFDPDNPPTIGVDIRMSFKDTRARWISSRITFPVK
ncbi:MAG: metallophosphoesterase [Candidatus Marinimicrobia bacterium]|nr:metallophosphoesterase [Candidatus Neomarinimicrobiota bacterium]